VPGAHVDPDWLGATLRRLHALDVPAGLGDSWDPLARVRGRIDRYERMTGYSQAHATTLRRLSDRIERELEGLRRSRAVGLVDGDPSPGNVVVARAELDRRMRAWRDPGDRTRWTPCRAPGS